jgi:hypothetical protein
VHVGRGVERGVERQCDNTVTYCLTATRSLLNSTHYSSFLDSLHRSTKSAHHAQEITCGPAVRWAFSYWRHHPAATVPRGRARAEFALFAYPLIDTDSYPSPHPSCWAYRDCRRPFSCCSGQKQKFLGCVVVHAHPPRGRALTTKLGYDAAY